MNKEDNPRFAVERSYMESGYKWIDWSKVPKEIRDSHVQGALDEYTNHIPMEVIILLLKEFQKDTGLIGKIMQEEIYSKDMSRRHLDIIEKLIDVVGDKANKSDIK